MKSLILIFVGFGAGFMSSVLFTVDMKDPSPFTNAIIQNHSMAEDADLIWSENTEFSTLLIESNDENSLSVALKSHPSIVAYIDSVAQIISVKGTGDKKIVINYGSSPSTVDLLTIHDIEEGAPVAFVDRKLDGSFDEKYIFHEDAPIRLLNGSQEDWHPSERSE